MTAVVASPSMRRLIAVTNRAARTNSPVLISGESGTGKELIARAVHHFSPRAGRPFIDVNCAALPEHLMESELFGYEKGAFSGAETLKPGFFEGAHTGTLFLDEIGEMDSRMQAKLLRVLDGQSYFRLGGSRKVSVDVRTVAATNLSLEDAVQNGRFRRDLFHRLDAIHLRVPPLRERIEDIAPLTRWFLRASDLRVSDEAMAALEDYSWPGNIRELKNCLNKAALAPPDQKLRWVICLWKFFSGRRNRSTKHTRSMGWNSRRSAEFWRRQADTSRKPLICWAFPRRTLIRKLKLYRSLGKQPVGTHRDAARIVA